MPFLQFALRASLAWRDSSRQFQSISSDFTFPWCNSHTKLEFPPFCEWDLSAWMQSPLSSCCYPDHMLRSLCIWTLHDRSLPVYSASTTSCPDFLDGTHCLSIFATLPCSPALLNITGAHKESSEVSIRDTYKKQQQQKAGWLVTCLISVANDPIKANQGRRSKIFLAQNLKR